jgi:hypothetical protein
MFDLAIRDRLNRWGIRKMSNDGRRIIRSYRPCALSQILSSRGDAALISG